VGQLQVCLRFLRWAWACPVYTPGLANVLHPAMRVLWQGSDSHSVVYVVAVHMRQALKLRSCSYAAVVHSM
jgi:hypothetical protein